MIDLQTVVHSYVNYEVPNVVLLKSGNNPADELTKLKGNNLLNYIIQNSKCDFPVKL